MWRVIAIPLALLSAFFVFYEGRHLVVTGCSACGKTERERTSGPESFPSSRSGSAS